MAVEILCRLTGGRLKIGAEGIRDKLTVKTQVTTEEGRPDIEIAVKGGFRVFVEAKLESDLHDGQLEQYRKELGDEGTLVLLTRYPVEIPATDAQPDVFRRWYQISDWLEDWGKNAITNTESYFLTKQFVEFLKIRNIAMEKVGLELAGGLKSLTNILKMLEEAINATAPRASGYYKFFDVPDEAIGFCLDKKKLFVGIKYDEPTILYFGTEPGFSVRKGAKEKARFGEVKSDEDGLYWMRELKLYSDEVKFFELSKDDQMKCLEKFVGECLAVAKEIEDR